MRLYEWAKRWNIPEIALEELKNVYGIQDNSRNKDIYSESNIQSLVRMEASNKGFRLWRNNVGATHTREGSFIRYGLANESTNVNSIIKSADLIGIKPVKITEKMIGYTIGQFISREIKPSGWRYSGTEREIAQLAWAELILSLGGDACFATGEGTL